MKEKEELLVAAPLSLRLYWEGDKLARMRLAWAAKGEKPHIETKTGRELAKTFADYVSGKTVTWPKLPIDFDALPRFHQKVLKELMRVPAGQVVSYKGLGELCGSPSAARAVGQVMACNRWPLIFPCHRVLRSDRNLGGFGPGLDMKRWLLELEGISPQAIKG